MTIGIINDKIKVDGIEYATTKEPSTPTPVELLGNEGFDTGTTKPYFADDWFYRVYWGDSGADLGPDYSLVERTADSNSGTYAAKVYTTWDNGGGQYFSYQLLNYGSLFIPNQTVQARLYAKRDSGAATIIIAYVMEGEEDNLYYNFTGAFAGTWSAGASATQPNSDQLYMITPDGTYTQYTATQATAPSELGYDYGYILMVVASANEGDAVFIDDYETLIDSTDEALNGGFETWTQVSNVNQPLTDWIFYNNNTDGIYPHLVIDQIGGVFDLTLSTEITELSNAPMVLQTITPTGDEGEDVDYSVTQTGDANCIFFLDNDVDNYTQIWNFNTSAWVAYSDPVNAAPNVSADYVVVVDNTTETGTITVPGSGKICAVALFDVSDGVDPMNAVLSEFSLTEEQDIGGNTVTILSTSTDSDATDLGDTDSILLINTTGGTPATLLEYTGDYKWKTNHTYWDFSDGEKSFKIGQGTEENDAVNLGGLRTNGVALLAKVENIDFTSTGVTTLYTVPEGKKLIIDDIVFVCTSMDAYSNNPTYNLGTNDSDYNSIVNGHFVAPTASDYSVGVLYAVGQRSMPTGGDDVKLNITIGATATTMVVTALVFGTLI